MYINAVLSPVVTMGSFFIHLFYRLSLKVLMMQWTPRGLRQRLSWWSMLHVYLQPKKNVPNPLPKNLLFGTFVY